MGSESTENVRRSEQSEELREHLRESLPEFMIPSLFLTVDRWPTLPGGKVDRNSLRSLTDQLSSDTDVDYVEPRDEMERTIARIWSEVLGVERVGVHDDFFELGGDSILAIHLVSRAGRSGIRHSTKQLFLHPTVAELAAVAQPGDVAKQGVATQQDAARQADYFPLARIDPAVLSRLTAKDQSIEDIYPLSPLQKGMLFHSLTSPTMYCYQVYSDLRGNVDPDALELAWRRAVDRNPSLRTTFLTEGLDEPLQVVRRNVDVPVRREDWTGLTGEQQKEKLETQLADELGDGFDLTRGPLLRLSIVRLSDAVVRVTFTGHHIVIDRWSFDNLVDEVMAELRVIQHGAEEPRLDRRPYRDFIAWLTTQDMSAAEAHWRRRLDGFHTPTPVPGSSIARDRTRHVDGGTGLAHLRLDADVTRTLTDWARRSGLTLNTVLQGAWVLLLSAYAEADDVVFGATTSGRPVSLPGVEGMVGLFINTLPVRARVGRESVLKEWLRELQAAEVDSRTFEFSALYDIQRWSEVRGSQPLFETIMVFENSGRRQASTSGRAFAGDDVDVETFGMVSGVNYPLVVVVEPGDTLNIFFSYDRMLFTDESTTRLTANFRTLLEAFPTRGEGTLGEQIELLDVEKPQTPDVQREPQVRPDVAPESQAELELLDLWEQILGQRPSSVEASFYEIGGHSLMALRLAERANQLFGAEVSLIDLFKEPTVRSMARLLTDADGEASKNPLVEIQKGGSETTLFCIHPGNGSVRSYRRLAQRLDPDQALFGLQDIWASHPTSPWTTMQEMAAAYVSEIRSVVPHGPYHLIGYSFGGWVVYEMAQQLHMDGERVATLVVIDTATPRIFRHMDIEDDVPFLSVLLRDLLEGKDRLQEIDLERDLAPTATESPLDRFVSIAWPGSLEEQSAGRTWIGQALALFKREVDMARRYHPAPYRGKVHLFRADGTAEEGLVRDDEVYAEPTFGWGEFCSDVEVSWFSGSHATIMFPPALDLLADSVQDLLEAEASR